MARRNRPLPRLPESAERAPQPKALGALPNYGYGFQDWTLPNLTPLLPSSVPPSPPQRSHAQELCDSLERLIAEAKIRLKDGEELVVELMTDAGEKVKIVGFIVQEPNILLGIGYNDYGELLDVILPDGPPPVVLRTITQAEDVKRKLGF